MFFQISRKMRLCASGAIGAVGIGVIDRGINGMNCGWGIMRTCRLFRCLFKRYTIIIAISMNKIKVDVIVDGI